MSEKQTTITTPPFPYPDENQPAPQPSAKPAAASVPAKLQQEPQVPVAAGPSTSDAVVKSDVNAVPMAAFKASFTRDFKGVSDSHRAQFVAGVCKALDIPTVMNPFYFLDLPNGKTVLYAPSEAGQLLAESRKLKIEPIKEYLDKESNIYFVWTRVTGPNGRIVENFGAMYLGGKSGQDRANLMMKTITKSQRRTIFAYCGLSMADDDDLQAMGYGQPQNPLAERTQQILAARADADDSAHDEMASGVIRQKPANPINGELRKLDAETKKVRSDLFKAMLAGKNAPFKDAKEAEAWIRLKADGKALHELDIDDCDRLINELIAPDDYDQRQVQPEPEGETHGID